MIVDSSAVVAVLLREPGWEHLVASLAAAETAPGIGAATAVETGIVLAARLGVPGKSLLARFLDEGGFRVIELTAAHWGLAVDAYLRYGKGRHPARLNYGDCLTYATARLAGEPLLCIGDDFRKTDLTLVPLRDPDG